MSCPPEPSLKVTPGPPLTGIRPEFAKGLIEQVGTINFQIQLFQLRKPLLLLVTEAPRFIQPDLSGFGHQRFMLLAFLPDLVAPNLVRGLREVLDNMKFIKYQSRLGHSCLGDANAGLAYVAADTL